MFFEPLGAAPDRRDVDVAAARTGAWHAFGEAAMVAAQRAVDLVKHAVRATVRALAFPVAVQARQYRRIAAPVQKNQRLLAARNPLGNGRQQWRRDHAVARLVVHVDAPDRWQASRFGKFLGAYAFAHGQALVPAGKCRLPAFQRRRCRAQQDAAEFGPHACRFAYCAAPRGGRCACGPAKPVPRPLLSWIGSSRCPGSLSLHTWRFAHCAALRGGRCACGPAKPDLRPLPNWIASSLRLSGLSIHTWCFAFRGGLQPGSVDGQVACRVTRAFLLLVAWVVLLIDHDQPQIRH